MQVGDAIAVHVGLPSGSLAVLAVKMGQYRSKFLAAFVGTCWDDTSNCLHSESQVLCSSELRYA